MKKLLITGATGALGRAVISQVNSQGSYEVFSAGRRPVDEMTPEVRCDIRSHEEIVKLFDVVRPDVILHLAASFSGSLYECYEVNVAPAISILDMIEERRLKTRVVLIGSAAEYGIVLTEENPIVENHVLAPVSVYGTTKAWQSQLVSLYKARGVDVICARVFNLFGPGVSDLLFAGRICNEIASVMGGKKRWIELGPLTSVRDYLSTAEAATQLLTIARWGLPGEIYHVASGVPVKMRSLLRQELEKRGLDLSIVKEDRQFSNRRGYDVPVIYADISKTKELALRGMI